MRDRIPGDPGRVKITREDGSTEFVHVERADNPEDPGTPLNKETLLRDQTETALFGNVSNRTVDDAFAGIAARLKMIASDMASLTLTVTDAAGTPIPGVYVDGVFTESGTAAKTDAAGKIVGYVSEGSIPLSVRNYYDIEDFSQTFTFAKGQSYTHTIQVNTRNFLKMTSARVGRFSENVITVDVDVLAGGGAGAAGYSAGGYTATSGPGGAAGDLVERIGLIPEPNEDYPAVIGSGGTGGTDKGKPGGNSSFMGVTAVGGNGATGGQYGTPGTGQNGNGGARVIGEVGFNHKEAVGNPGGASQKKIFKSFSETEDSGGGGASGGVGDNGGVGGTPGGGKGGNGGDFSSNETGGVTVGGNGKAGTGGGGGGGGAKAGNDDDGNWFTVVRAGGKGGSGAIAIRMHLKSAA